MRIALGFLFELMEVCLINAQVPAVGDDFGVRVECTKYHMNITKLFSCLFLCTMGFGALCQKPLSSDRFEIELIDGAEQTDLTFYELNYRTATIDLRKLKSNTGAALPDSFVVQPPNLKRFEQVILVVGLKEDDDVSSMVVMFVGRSDSRSTFFVDSDQDRNFNNDLDPIKLVKGSDPEEVVLSTTKGPVRLRLSSLLRNQEDISKISRQFALGLSAAVGSGDITYSYDDLTIGYPTNYFVKTTEKSISAALSYDWEKFNFGISASLQNFFYFTSSLDVRLGEPFYREGPFGQPEFEDNVNHIDNADEHPTNRLQLAVFGSYKISLSESIDIQPTFRIGRAHYLNAEYNRFVDVADQAYELEPRIFYEIGIRTEFAVGVAKAIFLELARNDQQWKPEEFLKDTPHANFESESVIIKLNVGYRFGF
ncbi:MAG: hypothetical protein ABJG78_19705 [Cyclobacteriaceae bacterium]